MSERVPPGKTVSGVWIVVAIVIIGIAGSIITIRLKRDALLTMTDVSALPTMAFVQDVLQPVDACELEYAGRDRRGARRHFDVVFVRSCTTRTEVTIPVPETWGARDVGFLLERPSATARWKVMIENDRVALDAVGDALHELLPIVSAKYATTPH